MKTLKEAIKDRLNDNSDSIDFKSNTLNGSIQISDSIIRINIVRYKSGQVQSKNGGFNPYMKNIAEIEKKGDWQNKIFELLEIEEKEYKDTFHMD